MQSKALGYLGEKIAADFLRQKGYLIIAQNFTIRGGELDIVAKANRTLIFVEVKTRTSTRFGEGIESIGRYKRLHMQRTIRHYLTKIMHSSDCDYRIDVIEITLDPIAFRPLRIEHIINIE